MAGKAYNARTLEPYPVESGGEFKDTLMKPRHFDRLDDKALQVNRITREQLEQAPDQGVVWQSFVTWVNKFNKTGNPRGAPIACGKNIRNFDLLFAAELNKLHGPKKDKTLLFNSRTQLDLEDLLFVWFEGEVEPKSMKMDELRPWFGMSSENAHNALVDVRQTGTLIMHFLKLHRELQRRKSKNGGKLIQFQGSLQGVC